MAENLYDIPTARRRTGREVFGDIREGFAAGLVGRDPRFSREQRQSKLTQATLQDAQALQQALASNNQRQAIDLLVDRANLLESMGEDASDTYALRDMIVQGNTRGAMGEVGTFLDAAKRRGLVSTPAPIESKYLTTDPSGRMGTVIPDASGNYRFQEAIGAGTPKPEEPETFTGSDGIERYATGKYAGYSVGAIADMMRQGQIATFGDAIPRTTQPQQATVRPPMRMPEAPAAAPAADEYVGLSAQEIAILEAEKEEKLAEKQRAEDEEARRKAKEGREVQAATRDEEEAANIQKMKEAEMLQLYGLADRLLDPNIYGDKVYSAATGALESKSPMLGALMTIGADYQDVTNFRNDIQFLQDIATMDNLGRMTGVLSQSDIQLLAQAATGIELSSDPEVLQQRLRYIKDKIQKKLIDLGYSPADLTQQASMYSNAQSEFDALLQELEGVQPTGATPNGR
jgi:hypothetical protein